MKEELDRLWQRIIERVRTCSDGIRHGNANRRELEIVESVRTWIASGEVKVHSGNQSYFDLLEARYPIGLNRIDWRGITPHEAWDVLQPQDGQVVRARDELILLGNARSVINGWLSKATAGTAEPVIWIGDACNLALEMSSQVFLGCYVALFSSGQHSYVIPKSGEWCINYTIEGQLFCGYSSDSTVTGSVDLDSNPASK